MKKIVLLTIVLPLLVYGASTGWARNLAEEYGSDFICYDVKPTSDAYILGGQISVEKDNGWAQYATLIKTDFLGHEIWRKLYEDKEGVIYQLEITSDDNYVLLNGSGLVKTDTNGAIIWSHSYDSLSESIRLINYFQETTDGGFILTGYSGNPRDKLLLLKTNEEGNVLWVRNYGKINEYYGYGRSVEQTMDGGYIATGWLYDLESINHYKLWLLKTDSNGDTVWTKQHMRGVKAKGCAVKQTSDGGYIVLGETSNNSPWFDWLLKTDSEGDTIWTNTYEMVGEWGGYDGYVWGIFVRQTLDGGYIIAGHSATMIKTDENGDTVWTRCYLDSNSRRVELTNDGGYIVLTYEFNPPGGWLYKTDSEGNIGDVSPISADIIEDLEFGTNYPITATIENLGRTTEAFDACCFILYRTVEDPLSLDTVYWDTTFVDSMSAGETRKVPFKDYDFPQVGGYHIHVKTMLDGDADPYNDKYVSPYFGAGITEQSQASSPPFEVLTAVGRQVLLSSQSEERSQLGIFDASGRLVDEVILEGPGTVSWGDGHSPGVYFIKSLAGRGEAHKVVLVR